MFSVNDLPENHVIEVVKSLDRDLDELKSAQRVGGASLVTHNNRSTATWDVEETVPNTVTFIRWRVLFTPTSGGTLLSLLSYDYDLSPADSTRPILSYPDSDYISSAGIAYTIAYTNNNFSGTSVLKFKVAVTSMDTGTLTITKVFSA